MKMLGVKVIVIWSFSHLLAGVGLFGEGESKIMLENASSNDRPEIGVLRRSQFLNTEASEPLTLVNALFQRFALDNTSNETASKGVTGTGGVVNLLLGDFVNGVFLGLNTACGRDSSHGGEGTLCNDHDTGALGVLLLEGGEFLGDFGDVGQSPAVALGEGESFGFVADEVVDVGDNAVELVLEELGDEGGGEGEDEGL